MIIKHGRHILGEIHEVRKGLWAFFLMSFRMLIGWAGKLRSHGQNKMSLSLFRTLIGTVYCVLCDVIASDGTVSSKIGFT